MTTTQLLLIIWVYIIGYTFSYIIWIRRGKQESEYTIEILTGINNSKKKEIESLRNQIKEPIDIQEEIKTLQKHINKQQKDTNKENKEDTKNLKEIKDPHKGMSDMEIAKYYDRLSKEKKLKK